MQRLATFRKGESPFSNGSVVAHDQSLAVYYDPPWAQLDACTVQNSADSLAMCFNGTVSNASAQILLDTGAQGAFCSTHFAQRAGILQKLQPGPPTVAHGVSGPVKIIGEVRIRLSIQGFSAVTTLSVADLGNQWDVILGDPWLRQHKVSLNYGDPPDAVVRKGHRKIILRHGSSDGIDADVSAASQFMSGSGPPVPVLSAVQMCRLVGRDAQKICCISVSTVAHDESRPEPADSDADPLPTDVHDAVNAELSQFSEVLVDSLPPGLPPDRGIGHTHISSWSLVRERLSGQCTVSALPSLRRPRLLSRTCFQRG